MNSVSGNGNEKAYLAEISEAAFRLVIKGQHDIAESLLAQPLELTDVTTILDDAAEQKIDSDELIGDTEKEQLVLARRGQGRFRAQLLERYGKCIMTGVSDPALLIASHIKPWRLGKDAAERLDVNNGFLLSPHVDHLFDRGFISFSDDGDLLVSPVVDPQDIHRLGISAAVTQAPCGPFSEKTKGYLKYHRDVVFIS